MVGGYSLYQQAGRERKNNKRSLSLLLSLIFWQVIRKFIKWKKQDEADEAKRNPFNMRTQPTTKLCLRLTAALLMVAFITTQCGLAQKNAQKNGDCPQRHFLESIWDCPHFYHDASYNLWSDSVKGREKGFGRLSPFLTVSHHKICAANRLFGMVKPAQQLKQSPMRWARHLMSLPSSCRGKYPFPLNSKKPRQPAHTLISS